VEDVVLGELGWIYRDQPTLDYGIDGHIEVLEGGRPTGMLIGVQIKSTTELSHTAVAFHFPVSQREAKYWQAHSLPVIFIVVDRARRSAFWAHVTEGKLRETVARNLRIDVPRDQPFDGTAKQALRTIARAQLIPAPLKRMRHLTSQQGLIRLALDGELRVRFQGRPDTEKSKQEVVFYTPNPENGGTVRATWVAPTWGTEGDEIPPMLPWANLVADAASCRVYDVDAWTSSAEVYEDGQRSPSFEQWLQDNRLNRAYRPEFRVGDDTEQYDLAVEVNDVGRGFLAVQPFLEDGDDWPHRQDRLNDAWIEEYERAGRSSEPPE
jgi:hypothetical protein